MDTVLARIEGRLEAVLPRGPVRRLRTNPPPKWENIVCIHTIHTTHILYIHHNKCKIVPVGGGGWCPILSIALDFPIRTHEYLFCAEPLVKLDYADFEMRPRQLTSPPNSLNTSGAPCKLPSPGGKLEFLFCSEGRWQPILPRTGGLAASLSKFYIRSFFNFILYFQIFMFRIILHFECDNPPPKYHTNEPLTHFILMRSKPSKTTFIVPPDNLQLPKTPGESVNRSRLALHSTGFSDCGPPVCVRFFLLANPMRTHHPAFPGIWDRSRTLSRGQDPLQSSSKSFYFCFSVYLYKSWTNGIWWVE